MFHFTLPILLCNSTDTVREKSLKTQVVIIGGGPSGLLLSQLLHVRGIDSVVLERRTREHVLSRIRAGVLERGVIDLMREAGISERMEREGDMHDGTMISYGDEMFRIDFKKHTGREVLVYGQTEITRDLYDAREEAGGTILFETENVVLHDVESDRPFVSYDVQSEAGRIDCDFIAGCDGFHGVSRRTVPKDVRTKMSGSIRSDGSVS